MIPFSTVSRRLIRGLRSEHAQRSSKDNLADHPYIKYFTERKNSKKSEVVKLSILTST